MTIGRALSMPPRDPAVRPGLQVVWFKRDLRVVDHRPLLEASRYGPVLPLLVVEPELWRQRDASARQWDFAAECIAELRTSLAELGQPLVVRVGDVVAVLERARRQLGMAGLWSHQETGNGMTYARDQRVSAWAASHGLCWQEHPQFGVIRRLRSRDGWAQRWEALMAEPLCPPPERLTALAGVDPGEIPSSSVLGLAPDLCPQRQRGGRSKAQELLRSFLGQRGAAYHRELSSPLTAERSCSRLSAHISWGTLSLREVVQASRAQPRNRARRAFEERLHWHCHFIQTLESQPTLEVEDLNPLTATLRSGEAEWLELPQAERLRAWAEGRTGLPFVDACMRSLAATGWLNFRMRAMVMSVASYHLWLPWRETGLVLARLFVDYEPGIHWCQCQMQSGTTGINTIRIYNPIKQGFDHDPEARFIRRWIPELAGIPAAHCHQPWTLPPLLQEELQWQLGRDYPAPIVDVAAAGRSAKERMYAHRQSSGFAAVAASIQERHGSRRSGLPQTGRRRRPREGTEQHLNLGSAQLSLDLDGA